MIAVPELFVMLTERAFIILETVQTQIFMSFVISTHTLSDAGGAWCST